MSSKRCTRCGKIKELSEFHLNRRSKDGYQYHCKPCQSILYKYSDLKPRYNYLHTRPQWEKRIVGDFVSALLVAQDKTGVNFTAEQIGRAMVEMRQRGVA